VREAVVLAATRSGIGKFNGSLRDFTAVDLGTIVVKEAIKRAYLEPYQVEEIIMGNVLSSGLGQNPARQVALNAGLPVTIEAYNVNMVCASGLKAIVNAVSEIRAGYRDLIIAGGIESMSRAPYLLPRNYIGKRLGNLKLDDELYATIANAILIDSMIYDGLLDAYNCFHMGITGEIIAQKFNLSREEIDKFALQSHQKAAKAISEGKFKDEIVPIKLKNCEIFATDEGVRTDTNLEKLAKLPPAFEPIDERLKANVKELFGIESYKLTAGNSSQISDGAAALVLASKEKAQELGKEYLAKIKDYCCVGVKPELVMYAPVPAVKELLKRNSLSINDIDLFEHNEAFASASIVVQRELGIDQEKFNVNGGAIARGHPIGASGAIYTTSLIYEMVRRKAYRGVITICSGGGNALAVLIERE
jgi:acetyl-CoA C-acetyltransferase